MVRAQVATESSQKKYGMAISFCLTFLATGTLGGLFLWRYINAMQIQGAYDTYCDERGSCPDIFLYDVVFALGTSTDREQSRAYRT